MKYFIDIRILLDDIYIIGCITLRIWSIGAVRCVHDLTQSVYVCVVLVCCCCCCCILYVFVPGLRTNSTAPDTSTEEAQDILCYFCVSVCVCVCVYIFLCRC